MTGDGRTDGVHGPAGRAEPDAPVRVLLVDDHHLVRAGFRLVLDTEPDLVVVGEAADAAQALAELREQPADVVLMYVQMPGLSGIEATRRIVAERPARVIVLTTFDREDYLLGALEAGASGFLTKTASPEALVAAIRSVAQGEDLVGPDGVLPLLRRASAGKGLQGPDGGGRTALERLSDREAEVLGLMAHGLSNTEIAQRLVLAMPTVKTHVSRIFAKTGSRDRAQAVIFAFRSGLVREPENPPESSPGLM